MNNNFPSSFLLYDNITYHCINCISNKSSGISLCKMENILEGYGRTLGRSTPKGKERQRFVNGQENLELRSPVQ